MNNLVNVSTQTPIEIALGIDENGMTTARRLYEFLEFRGKDFSRWARKNILENQFAVENEDYLRVRIEAETPTGGKIERNDYKLTASFAKKLSMMSKSEKGEQARQYFVKVEDKMKNISMQLNNISPELRAIIMHDKKISQVERRIESMDRELQDFKMDMPILGIEIDKITTIVRRKGTECLGGKKSNAYKDKSIRGMIYHDIYRELKRQFGVSTYKAIKRSQCDVAVGIVEAYIPPFVISERIRDCNNQIKMDVS